MRRCSCSNRDLVLSQCKTREEQVQFGLTHSRTQLKEVVISLPRDVPIIFFSPLSCILPSKMDSSLEVKAGNDIAH